MATPTTGAILARRRACFGRRTPAVGHRLRSRSDVEMSSLALLSHARDGLRSTLQVQAVPMGQVQLDWRLAPLPGAGPIALQAGMLARSQVALGEWVVTTVELVSETPLAPQGRMVRIIPAPGA